MGPDGRRERTPAAVVKGVDKAEGTKSCLGTPELASVWKVDGKVSEDGETISIDVSQHDMNHRASLRLVMAILSPRCLTAPFACLVLAVQPEGWPRETAWEV